MLQTLHLNPLSRPQAWRGTPYGFTVNFNRKQPIINQENMIALFCVDMQAIIDAEKIHINYPIATILAHCRHDNHS